MSRSSRPQNSPPLQHEGAQIVGWGGSQAGAPKLPTKVYLLPVYPCLECHFGEGDSVEGLRKKRFSILRLLLSPPRSIVSSWNYLPEK